MKLLMKSLIVASALVGIGAHAEGLYVGGSIGGARLTDSTVGGIGYDRSDTGGKVYGGYEINSNLAVELGYANLGKHDGPGGGLKADGVFLDAVGTYPLGNNFSVLGRVGVFSGKLDSDSLGSDRSTNWKLGAGLQYAVNQNVAIRGEWERYRFDSFGGQPKSDLYTVGVNYKF
ncbi:MAG: hypothetical protein JWP52_430 [Rhizobacter sp.]|nr:hypothetical protein [Rhizobacter sp.]